VGDSSLYINTHTHFDFVWGEGLGHNEKKRKTRVSGLKPRSEEQLAPNPFTNIMLYFANLIKYLYIAQNRVIVI
jgi:hypothetical protein